MARGREFQIVGAATAKLREPKHVRTRGTNNNLRVRRTLGSRYGFVGNAGGLELDAPLNRESV